MRLSKIFLMGAMMNSAWALAAPDPMCRLHMAGPQLISYMPEPPSWFAKVSTDGQFAYVIMGGNQLMTLEESDDTKRFKSIPGGVDPVPCPDHKILTVPGLSLYDVRDILAKGNAAEALIDDETMPSVYQSCALVKVDGNERTYRVIMDDDDHVTSRDYKIKFGRGKPTVEPLGEATALCPDVELKTKIISKTGRFVSGYNYGTGTTQIYNLSAGCKLAVDLGYPTGKLEFNYDDSMAVFHLDFINPADIGGYAPAGPEPGMTKDVFAVNLTPSGDKLIPNNLRRLSSTSLVGAGYYYPSFTQDGRVGMLHEEGEAYSYEIVDPKTLQAFDFLLPPPDGTVPSHFPADWKVRLHAASAIGGLWAERCHSSKEELSMAELASFALAIPKDNCRQFVASWDAFKAGFARHKRVARDTRFAASVLNGLRSSDLLSSCRLNPGAPPPPPKIIGKPGNQLKLTIQRVIKDSCVGCHDGTTALDFNDKVGINKIWTNINRDPADPLYMPMGGWEDSDDGRRRRQMLVEYVLCKKTALDANRLGDECEDE